MSVGFQDHDSLLALGAVPVAAPYWFGDTSDVVYPWADDEAAGASVQVLQMPDGISVERVAALEPDLIVGVYGDITPENYGLLAAVAPTIARPKEFIDYGTPWQVQTEMIGRAAGRPDRAREIVAQLEGRFAAIRNAHPQWRDRTVAVATYGTTAGSARSPHRTRGPGSSRCSGSASSRRSTPLSPGTRSTSTSARSARIPSTPTCSSGTKLQYVDGGRSTVENDEVLRGLDAMRERRTVYLSGDLENAFGFNTVLSLPYVLDHVVPLIEQALAEQ